MVKWVGPAQYEDKATKTLMMLPADYSLVQVTPQTPLDIRALTKTGQGFQEVGRNVRL
jgi:hypothetical protein